MSSEHFLDFIQGLTAQIRGLKQLVFGALDEITDVVDVLSLEAVRATNRQFEIINRTHQDRIERRRRFFFLLLIGFSFGLNRAEDES